MVCNFLSCFEFVTVHSEYCTEASFGEISQINIAISSRKTTIRSFPKIIQGGFWYSLMTPGHIWLLLLSVSVAQWALCTLQSRWKSSVGSVVSHRRGGPPLTATRHTYSSEEADMWSTPWVCLGKMMPPPLLLFFFKWTLKSGRCWTCFGFNVALDLCLLFVNY